MKVFMLMLTTLTRNSTGERRKVKSLSRATLALALMVTLLGCVEICMEKVSAGLCLKTD